MTNQTKTPGAMCDCNQGRLPCSCRPADVSLAQTPGAMVLVPRELLDRLDFGIDTKVALAALPELRKLLVKQPPEVGGEPEVLAWMYRREGGEILGQLVAIESEALKHIREGKHCEGRTLLIPRSDYYDWRALIDRAHVAPLLAEIDRLKLHFDAMQLQRDHHRDKAESLKSRIAELEAELARK